MKKENKENNKQSNTKDTVIAFIILLCLIAIAAALIYFIAKGIFYGVSNLMQIASSFDTVVIVALITGVLSLVGVILSSIITKAMEYNKSKREYLAQKREIPYGQYVDMVYKLVDSTKGKTYTQKEMLEDMVEFSKELTLWGSKDVVRKWNIFREKSIEGNDQGSVENLFIMEDILIEMRKDLGLKKTKKGDLLGIFVNDINKYR